MTRLSVAALGDGQTGVANRASTREGCCDTPTVRTFDSGRADATRSR